MRNTVVAGLTGVMLAVATVDLAAQVAGSTSLSQFTEELKTLARGWSAKKRILDKPVYNEEDERVGEVNDIIIAPDKSIAYAIIGVGGFLGIGEHQVAVPFNWFKSVDDKIVLPGVTKDMLNAIPPFDYAE
jgi:sporulation protein YlmC with PRC-barrel domain